MTIVRVWMKFGARLPGPSLEARCDKAAAEPRQLRRHLMKLFSRFHETSSLHEELAAPPFTREA